MLGNKVVNFQVNFVYSGKGCFVKNIVMVGFMGTGKTTIACLLAEKFNAEYIDIDDIIEQINQNQETTEETKKSAISLFEAAKSWKVFASKNEEATKIEELIQPGVTSILDLSIYSSTSTFNVRALLIGLVSKKLFSQRILARKKE